MAAGKAEDLLVSIDGGKWYGKKVQQVLNQVQAKGDPTCSSAVPVLPVVGWKEFPSVKVPSDYSYGTIYEHIITNAKLSGLDGDPDITTDFNTTKPMMKGRQFFLSGHVKYVEDCSKNGYYFLKSKVMASYSISTTYNVSITLRNTDSTIVDASCDCKASTMGRCNHVAALLFALEDYTVQFGFDIPACTSLLCSWNVGRKRSKDPAPAHEPRYKKKAAPNRIINFDPRPEYFKNVKDTEDQFQNKFITNLPSASSNTVFSHLLEVDYEDYVVDTEALQNRVSSAVEDFKSVHTCNNSTGPFEVPDTKDQSDSPVWIQARAVRVTASIAKDVVGMSSRRAKYNFLRRHLWGLDKIKLKSMTYGKNNEDAAFQQYVKQNTRGETVIKSGFWVNPNFPELGCSPDGLIMEGSYLKGILEIKCPIILEHLSPYDIEQLPLKQSRNQCYTMENGVPRLKRTHKYYFQIQMQMAVCDVGFCDFAIFSPKGMSVERIVRDSIFWQGLLPRLQQFHRNVMLPEYLEMRVPRRLLPITL